MKRSAFIGYDSRFGNAYMVAVRSLMKHSTLDFVQPLLLPHLRGTGIYARPMSGAPGAMLDGISNAPMATEFALSRFFVPLLAKREGVSLFCDSDFLFRGNVDALFDMFDPKYAVMCVKHNHAPAQGEKMDGQVQTSYARKNWSSLMLINNEHPANMRLTLELLNKERGLYFHQMQWLADDEIGELPPEWNYLVGVSPHMDNPKAVHFTDGTPDLPGYENVQFAAEWRKTLVEVL